MCGICGVVSADKEKIFPREMLKAMTNSLAHRGPDDGELFLAPGIGLGHRRLRVIDIEGGKQPMQSAQHGLVIVYNGEIYNFVEIREALCQLGETFKTRSDTEVVLKGYARWGAGLLNKLVGMFAFAIWDIRKKKLFIARDRLGVKPLYWASQPDGGIAFGSELSSLRVSGLASEGVNKKALGKYLALGYVLGSQSIMDGVERLTPGKYMEWTPQDGVRIHQYWDLAGIWRDNTRKGLVRSVDEAGEEFEAILSSAVNQRLVSDVPLGAFLSGGIDSSIIAALMSDSVKNLKTFCIGFKQRSFDESEYARKVADYIRADHTEEVVGDCSPELLLEIVSSLDEPFADTSIIPTYSLCKMTRQNVTVSLSGDGGDELLAGYITHRADDYYKVMSRAPGTLIKGVRTLVKLIPDSQRKVNMIFKIKQFLAAWPRSSVDAHAWWRMLLDPELLSLSGVHGVEIFEDFRLAAAEAEGLTDLDKSLYVDYKTWLVDDVLFKTDRASMMHGLEVRSPFLDHRLVEFSTRLHPDLKKKGSDSKILLKRLAESRLPCEILQRKKAGFNSPVGLWLKTNWLELSEEMFRASKIANLGIDPAPILVLWNEHKNMRRNHGYVLFSFLMLLLWVDTVGLKHE